MPPSIYLQQQAAELARRGIAEARGGNRASAAALLRRAVQLDPEHETAWLWLGGVAADAQEAAFALRCALELNPANENARHGLHEIAAAASTPSRPAAREPDRRWQHWRQSRTNARSFTLALWAIPVVLLLATAGLRAAFALTPAAPIPTPAARLVAKSVPPATPTPEPLATATALPEATATSQPQPQPQPTDTPRGAIMAYLVTLEEIRRALREASDSYLANGQRRSTAERATAARSLRDAVERGREQIEAVEPPAEARDAQRVYLEGLALETAALDDVLAFYAAYDSARSNSAALRMQAARAAIDAANKQWSELAGRYGISLASSGQP